MTARRVKRQANKTFTKMIGPVTRDALWVILNEAGAVADLLTPVDTATLLNSRYAPNIKEMRGGMVGRIGYTASYAAAVHDAPGTLMGLPRPNGRGNYWAPAAEPGFLTTGFEETIPEIPSILRSAYGV
jgi:hypothetical protein